MLPERRNGFILIEVLVSLVLIGLAAAMVANLVLQAHQAIRDLQAEEARARGVIACLRHAEAAEPCPPSE